MTVGRGWCTSAAYSLTKTPEKIGGRKGCDAGIYKTTQIPSKELSDLRVIVDRPEWHEFNARVVRRRNIAAAPKPTSNSQSCALASSNAGATDAHHYGDYVFNKMYKAMANNGGEVHGLNHSALDAIRLYEVVPNSGARVSNITGNDLLVLGDIPLLQDRSFIAQVPCETPILMAGVDRNGLVIKRDQIPMSLRTGEARTCNGCHLHGSPGRQFSRSLAAVVPPFPLSEPSRLPTWVDEIKPIMDTNCVGCHELFGDYKKLTYDPYQREALNRVQMRGHKRDSRRFGLHRPATSKYVNSMFARESMLYWVAAGKRTDGRRNADFDDDLDYPRDHPDVRLEPAQLRQLAAWLDGGYPYSYSQDQAE